MPLNAPATRLHPTIATTIGDDEFAAAMAGFAPFEARPRLAVAVSGGVDSMALCLLTDRWVRVRGGSVLALTVDHGLRPESTEEAAQVADWLTGRAVAHETLTWRPGRAAHRIQARARDARYRLMAEACRRHGIVHLLLGHSLDDQAETVLLRLAKGSGTDGLAGMAPLRETAWVRQLRPLLGFSKRRLRAVCAAAGQPWIEDPSNADLRFARSRLRGAAATLAAEGLGPERLADTARRVGRGRAILEESAADLVSAVAAFYPEGCATIDRTDLLAAHDELALRALAALLATLGGAVYPPRLHQLEILLAELRRNREVRRTLAGCRIVSRQSGRAGRLLIFREAMAARQRLPAPPGASVWWDRRFVVAVPRALAAARPEIRQLGPLGAKSLAGSAMPSAVRQTLPGLYDGARLIGIPKLPGVDLSDASLTLTSLDVIFMTTQPAAGTAHTVVPGRNRITY